MSESCRGCFTVIAPHDPERVERKGKVWHYSCLRKARKLTQDELQGRLAVVRARRNVWNREIPYPEYEIT